MSVGKLTDIECKNAKYYPNGSGNKLSDGGGLVLQILPPAKGEAKPRKYWHLYYRFLGKQKTLSLGVYPTVGLLAARDKRSEAKKQLAEGKDPGELKKIKKLTISMAYENNFEALTRKWHADYSYTWNAKHAETILKRFEANIFPSIGKRPINDIKPVELLAAVEKVQERGNHDLAHRTMQICGRVFRYAVARGMCDRDITRDMKGALAPVKSENRRYLQEKELPDFLYKLERYDRNYGGKTLTKLAFQLIIHTFVRSGELRGAKWDEFDFKKAEWKVPKHRMKMKSTHLVPLTKQSIKILKEIEEITGDNFAGYVFPGQKDPAKIMSENTLLKVIKILEYTEETTVHGFRSTASTILHENGFESQWIERQLAHEERNQVKAAYDHSEHLVKRREMMQWWSNHLDELTK